MSWLKAWKNYPPDTSTPINQPALIALEDRVENYVGAVANIGPGVADWDAFRVHATGVASMSVDVGPATSAIQSGYIAMDAAGSVERYNYASSQLNVAVGPADPTNPRIDQVVLVPGTIDTQVPSVQIIPGTPTAGATLLNRNGVAAIPPQRTLLADILVGAAVATITNGNIRDRRLTPVGNMPSPSGKNAVAIVPHPNLMPNNVAYATAQSNGQVFVAVFLPRRIVGANTIRFKYAQITANLTGNFNFAMYDGSGRFIVQTGSQAFNGVSTTVVNAAPTITPTTFESGWYYAAFGVGTLTGGGAIAFLGATVNQANSLFSPSIAGVAYWGTGGVAMPNELFGLADVGAATGAVPSLILPTFTLSAE